MISWAPAWPLIYAWIRRIEGGWADHPRDPGGVTYAGISLRAVVGLDADRDGRLDFDLDQDGDVDRDDMVALWRADRAGDPAAATKIEGFYRDRYAAPVRASELPWPLSLYVVDAAVHHGPGPAALILQRALGVTTDGVIGPQTLRAAANAQPVRVQLMLAHRLLLLHRILVKRGETFALGWFRRVVDLEETGLRGVE